jgi:hypothetical protein
MHFIAILDDPEYSSVHFRWSIAGLSTGLGVKMKLLQNSFNASKTLYNIECIQSVKCPMTSSKRTNPLESALAVTFPAPSELLRWRSPMT